MNENLGLIVVISFSCALIGALLGDMKKRFWEGAALGALLGPIGCIIAILLPEP
jgi:predicted membrane protein